MEYKIIFLLFVLFAMCGYICYMLEKDDEEDDEEDYEKGNMQITSEPTERWQILGNTLGEIIISITEQQHKMLHKVQEKMEMCYLLLLETDRIIFGQFREHHAEIMDVMLRHVLIDSRGLDESKAQTVLNEYNDRVFVYMSCKELISEGGATVGSKTFALSHFLQKARGKTSGRDVLDVILKKRDLTAEDINEFVDFLEMAVIVLSLTSALVSIKRTIDNLKDLPETELKSRVYIMKQKLAFLRMRNISDAVKSFNFNIPNEDADEIKEVKENENKEETNMESIPKKLQESDLATLKEKVKDLEIKVLQKRIKELEEKISK